MVLAGSTCSPNGELRQYEIESIRHYLRDDLIQNTTQTDGSEVLYPLGFFDLGY